MAAELSSRVLVGSLWVLIEGLSRWSVSRDTLHVIRDMLCIQAKKAD